MKDILLRGEIRDLEKVQVLLDSIKVEVEKLYSENKGHNPKFDEFFTEEKKSKLEEALYSLFCERKVTDSHQEEIWTKLLTSMSLSTKKNESVEFTDSDSYESKLVKVWGMTSAQFIMWFNKLIRRIIIRINNELEAIV